MDSFSQERFDLSQVNLMDAFHVGQPVSCALVLSHSNSLTWLTGTLNGRNSINVTIHTCAVFFFDVFKCRL